ncbi:MAG: TlyA family RNA methyltransferase [Aquabacterium sp.]|jgi:23S rRNA (cytidine1920-2'-O)/16S rRNA (cytidine1409-2'-O)-methyltransferase|nr:MAG: TlyA family RNA methyltransferase [Aquabacterium sp.]
MRADQLLVNIGLAPTRSAAQRLIERGAVRWRTGSGWAVPRKAGENLPEGCEIELTDDAELRWASRGGLKLEGALRHTGITADGRVCLDVGQSTGGFTDVLLAQGARQVVGVDVGHGQLVDRLRADARVRAFEGLNARELTRDQLGGAMPADGFGLIVADLSFISLAKVLPAWPALLADDGEVLALVKPQFEVGSTGLGKHGVVRDEALYPQVERGIRAACAAAGLEVVDWFNSAIRGGGQGNQDGNREYFIRARHAAAPTPKSKQP